MGESTEKLINEIITQLEISGLHQFDKKKLEGFSESELKEFRFGISDIAFEVEENDDTITFSGLKQYRLRKYQEKNNFKDFEMSKKLGISSSHYNALKNGKKAVTDEELADRINMLFSEDEKKEEKSIIVSIYELGLEYGKNWKSSEIKKYIEIFNEAIKKDDIKTFNETLLSLCLESGLKVPEELIKEYNNMLVCQFVSGLWNGSLQENG